MFVPRRNGPGTALATGMYILGPLNSEYNIYTEHYDGILFDDTSISASSAALNWQDFLLAFLSFVAPVGVSNVCGFGAASDFNTNFEGQLFLNPWGGITDSGFSVTVKSEIIANADYVFVESGVEVKGYA
jgi:hypothetical protein